MNRTKVDGRSDERPTRRQYLVPQLVCYGDVAVVTRGGGPATGDALGMTMICWIAEALYGVDAPRTQVVRKWLSECYDQREAWALAAVPLYRRFGVRVAGLARRHSFVASALRPLFDRAVIRSHQHYSAKVLGETSVRFAH